MKGKLLILAGISGSGKSTYAHELWMSDPDKYVIVNRDKVRELLFGYTEENVEMYYRLPKMSKYEKQVTRYCDTLINDGLNHGKTVIIDATNLQLKYLRQFNYWNVETELILCDVDVEIAVHRDSQRTRKVGRDVIERQYAQYRSLQTMLLKNGVADMFNQTSIEMNPDNEGAYIFDIDGTLAHMVDRSPYEWHRVGEDVIDTAVADTLHSMYRAGFKIIICTGRDGACEEETKQWLADHKLPYHEFMIRPKGDMRPDWIVKEEMWRELAEDYNIVGLFDDRLQVVRRARALGLKVFNVEYHNF